MRPCEAAWSPVPPFKGRSGRLRPREAAEAALGGRRSGDLPSGQGAPTARRDQAARWRSARLRPRRCPRRPRSLLRPRTRPGTGAPLRPEGNCRRIVPCRAAAAPDRTGPGEPPGMAPGRGGGTWRLPVMACVRTTASTLRTQLPASVASCQRSFRVGAAGPRPSRRTASWQTASWRPPKHNGSRARTCGARASCIGAPRIGLTASALHCRIGPTTYNCYWENAERASSARGRDEGGGRPAVLPVSEPGSGGGRSRLSLSNRPKRAAARLRCGASPLLATETSPRLYRQCRDAGRGPAGKPLLGDIQTC